MILFYRAYLGLLEILGIIMATYTSYISNVFVKKSLKSIKGIKDPIEMKNRLKKLEPILTMGIKNDIKYLTELPTKYFYYKISKVMNYIDVTEKEFNDLRKFYYNKKRYSMLLRYKFNIKKNFEDEYNYYSELINE